MTDFADFRNKANVLFINLDQQRHDYLGYAGASWVQTPNIDRIAARGRVFRNCYSTSPVCAPARIGLASGLRPHRLGSMDNGSFLPAGTPTYYQQLRDHGYRVGCVGKLDLAKPDHFNGLHGDRPCTYAWGFTDPHECEGKMHAGQHAEAVGPYTRYLAEKGLLERFHQDYRDRFGGTTPDRWYRDSVLPAEDFEDTYIGRHAASWLRQAPTDYPWHYFVTFVGPHDPFDPPSCYADRYRHAEMPTPISSDLSQKPERIRRRAKDWTPEQIVGMQRQYCAAITAIDDAVGEILDALEASGQADRTYIVFSADHGEMLCDHSQLTKHTPYEGAWRIPLIAAGPGIAPGTCDELVELIDINPTICDLAGVPSLQRIDARSFAPILRGETDRHRDHVAIRMQGFDAIRQGQWKYATTANDSAELYHLGDDPDECHNLIDQQPEKARALQGLLHATLLQGGVTVG
ncbi:MAG: sulfatase [Planctomycetota bacterium]